MRELIDSTEMYLRTVYELGEEGIPPLRARLAERLHLSAPAVSETVARLEQDGLLHLRDDRTLELTDRGRATAVSVMRKHRLAERLLTDVIGLEWNLVHTEACRWEHVISDEVERRLVELLHSPTHDAHGNPIPGLEGPTEAPVELVDLATAATGAAEVTIRRISEHLQNDVDTMKLFEVHGVRPGGTARVTNSGDDVIVDADGTPLRLGRRLAQYVYVEPAGSV